MKALLLAGSLLLLATSFLVADAPISMKVSPTVSFAPANLVVRATIEKNAENRAVQIIAESHDFYRSSEVQLDGDRAPRTNMFEFRSLPEGEYHVRAILTDARGRERAFVRSEVNVIASGAGH